jgi:hypothetical protein
MQGTCAQEMVLWMSYSHAHVLGSKPSLFLSNSWHPFDMPPFLDQEILHVLVNLPIGSPRSDTVIAGKPSSVPKRK